MIKRYPNDNNQTIGIRLPSNGNPGRSFFNTSQTTEEQAISNYINLLLTRRGERYYLYNFGIGIQEFLFEPNSDKVRNDIEFAIRSQCDYWLPYIINHKIDVRQRANLPGLNSDPEQAIQIVITFSVGNSNANKTITIFQRQGQVTANVE